MEVATGASVWLSESRRSLTASAIAAFAMLAFGLPRTDPDLIVTQTIDNLVVVLAAYLACYVVLTGVTFGRATTESVRDWVQRSGRGTWLQRYILGTAPGPGIAIFVGLAGLLVAVVWLPGEQLTGSTLPAGGRVALGVAMILAGWAAVVVSFAVAYQAEDLRDVGSGLSFSGSEQVTWTDYLYFSLAVTTTFGTTDVEVTSGAMRRTVSVHAVLAFVINTVILGAVISALLG